MASPAYRLSSEALDQWRPNGDRLSYNDVGWSGAAVGIVMHASLHFFSVAIPSLERGLALFGPPERLAFGLTDGFNPLATWLSLLLAVAAWVRSRASRCWRWCILRPMQCAPSCRSGNISRSEAFIACR